MYRGLWSISNTDSCCCCWCCCCVRDTDCDSLWTTYTGLLFIVNSGVCCCWLFFALLRKENTVKRECCLLGGKGILNLHDKHFSVLVEYCIYFVPFRSVSSLTCYVFIFKTLCKYFSVACKMLEVLT